MLITRRNVIAGSAVAAGGLALPAFAKPTTKVRVGYLHTVAVDSQIWLGQHIESFAKQGLALEMSRFDTGLTLFQAMVGGSLDVVASGAVISNFPARGQGKVFLINDIEFATAQLWVRPGLGIKSIKDLKGKRIATTKGTTAQVFLDLALKSVGMTEDDVEVENQSMANAVTSFISGAAVREKVPGARMLVDASKFYPQAAIVDGWAARNDYYESKKDVLRRIIAGWIEANDFLVKHTSEALQVLHSHAYKEVPINSLHDQYKDEKAFTAAEWTPLYENGTVTNWLNQVTRFFIRTGGISHPVMAQKYFDSKLFLEVTNRGTSK
ncbi:MAG: ABC transporter substrate-binding protein [Acidiphilium sp. 34-60-192]|nr:MAG: ABC transporter substrate-binding protein [Acidiphilium sp. 34-60-192]